MSHAWWRRKKRDRIRIKISWLGKLQKILETMAARVAGDCARGALSSTPASTCPRRSRRAGAAERGKRLLVSRRDILSGTSVAMGLKVSRPSSSARAAPGAAPGEATVAYEDAMVSIGSQQIPVAVWAPSAGVGGSPPGTTSKGVAGYQHSISIAKIASVLFRLGRRLPTLFDQSMTLDPSPWVFRGELTAPEGGYTKAVVLCHGYLGSRYDLVDFAEALARAGWLVLSPEFAEALSNPATLPKASVDGVGVGADRSQIMAAVLDDVVLGRFGVPRGRVALVGHSAGAGTAVTTEGEFLARVAIGGFRKPLQPDLARILAAPLLVVASSNDSVIGLAGIQAAVSSLGVPTREFTSGSDLAVGLGEAGEDGTAFIKFEGEGAPCHISFLSSRTNMAMVGVLSPLLPVARALGVPLLDFDVYDQTRDSDAVAADLVPAVIGWLNKAK